MLEEFCEAFDKFATAIAKLTKTIERVVTSSAKGLIVISDSAKRKRLKTLLTILVNLQYQQLPLPNFLRGYCKVRDPKMWHHIQGRMAEVNKLVLEILELLEKDTSDMVIEARDAYKTILYGMKDRKKLFEFFLTIPPPTTEEEFAALLQIADTYDWMVDRLISAQASVAGYLTEGKENKLISPYFEAITKFLGELPESTKNVERGKQ